ncbi:hypothetical protein ACSF6B_00025 [Escherichia coli]|uniref:hypothetical protein n=1 Tax=Escherichia coli TaxID=562 RepID=UPI003EE8ECFE
MDNKTISCPFCFTQSPHGVRICRGCHAKVAYGESPLSGPWHSWFQFVALALAWLVFSLTGSTPVSVITFFASVIILICIIKKKYADRVVFIR